MINNTDKVYQDLLRNILENGKRKGDRTGTGTISIPHASVEFDMSEGFPLLTTKKMFTRGITHELLWFLKGDTNIQYLVQNGVNIWTPDAYREYKKHMERGKHGAYLSMDEFKTAIINDNGFADTYGELGPVYGKQWVNWRGYKVKPFKAELDNFNQIEQVVDKLKNKPDDRRMIVSAWNIADIDDMALPPCHYDFHLYTEELTPYEQNQWKWENDGCCYSHDLVDKFGFDDEPHIPKRKISLIWDQRSVDTFLGLPFNIASYGILLHMFAQQANMVPDKLVGHLKNVHIYSNHVEQCKEQISREPMALPQLELEKADNIFSYCYENVKFVNYESHPTIKGEISV